MMTDQVWEVLLGRIKDGKCTPFLGAGVNAGLLPTGGKIAEEWATDEGFPLRFSNDLSSVAQFLAIKYKDALYPKDKILRRFSQAEQPDFSQPSDKLECLRTLADLPLPVYMTTNYDHYMVKALEQAGKQPRVEICRWHSVLKTIPGVSTVFNSTYQPSSANPVVFFLHGSEGVPNSLVLTEDDYLDFLVNVSRSQKILPPRIQEALTTTSLLFIGYRLRDIDFRVIYRGLVQSMDGSQRRLSITVQVTPPDDSIGDPQSAEDFMNRYFEKMNVSVYWGKAGDFATELRNRWERFR
jgi:hypothetical protein